MLKEKIYDLWKEAFKAKNLIAKEAYESIKARILTAEKSGTFEMPLTDEVVINLIDKEIKELKESQSFYKKDSEEYKIYESKIMLLSVFMPAQMTESEVIEIIKDLAKTESNKGKLIGATVKAVGNRFDKSKIAKLVNTVING